MEIDATVKQPNSGRTYEDYKALMRRRCFGCGSNTHGKANCPSKNAQCHYCARVGHLETVCQDKFLGRAKGGAQRTNSRFGRRIAATGTNPFTLFPEEAHITESTTTSPNLQTLQEQITAQTKQTQQILSAISKPQSF